MHTGEDPLRGAAMGRGVNTMSANGRCREARVLNCMVDVLVSRPRRVPRRSPDALDREVPSDYVWLDHIAPEPADPWSSARRRSPASSTRRLRVRSAEPARRLHMRTPRRRPASVSRTIRSVSGRQLHATDLYREDLYAHLGVEHQIAFHVAQLFSSGSWQSPSVRRERDYSDPERDLLTLARPHLIQAYRNALDFADRRSSRAAHPASGPPSKTWKRSG